MELIGFGLLTLVLASAALLRLTMRLSEIEGLTPPNSHEARWLQRFLHTAHFAQRGTGRHRAS